MKRINTKLALAVSLAVSLSACSPNMTTDEYLAQAKVFSEKRDHNSAIIALKNAVSIEPKNPNVRFSLGAAYLAQGDYLTAEKELEKAEKLGSVDVLLLTYLVQAKVKLNKFDYVYQLIEQVDTFADVDQVMLLTYAGIAAIHQDKTQLAKEYIEDAISLSEDSIYGQIGKAYISHSGNNYQDGLNTVDELLSVTPDFAEALLLKGYLLQASEQFDAAANTFAQYSKIRPKDITARFFVAQNYVFAQNFDAAEPQVDLLLKISEYHPLANQLKAEIEYAKGNFKQAKKYAVISFQQDKSFTLSKIIAGMSAYKLDDFEQSYQYLLAVKNLLSPAHLVRKLIIDLQFKLGYDTEAVAELQSLAELDMADPALLTMASNQMLTSGNVVVAQELLNSAIALDSSNPVEIAKQGITQLRLKQADKGIAILEQALKLDPDLVFAEQGLAIGYIGNKQYLEALEIARKWQSSSDDETKNMQGYLLEAKVLEQQNKTSEAKILFNKVLELESENIAALYKLATFAHTEGDELKAFSYYTEVLKQQPQHVRSIINFNRLVAFSITEDRSLVNKAISFFKKELNQNTDNNYLKMNLAYIHQLNKNYEAAIELFKDIEGSKKPLNGIEVALGDSYKALGKWQEAEKAYQKLTDNEPKNFKVVHKLLILFEQQNQFEKALTQIEKTLRFNQRNTGFILLKTYYQSLLGITPKASDLEKIKDNDKTANHWIFDKTQGNFAYKQRNFDASTKFYASAFQKQANSTNAINWAKSVALKGNKQEAIQVLETFIAVIDNKEPVTAAKVMLGGAYLNTNKLDKALAIYEFTLKAEPNNVLVLNNLSYITLQQGNAKKSLVYAEKAIALKANDASIIDTYAQALVANKQFTLAIEQYNKALKISDNNAEIAIHKAEALELKAGKE